MRGIITKVLHSTFGESTSRANAGNSIDVHERQSNTTKTAREQQYAFLSRKLCTLQLRDAPCTCCMVPPSVCRPHQYICLTTGHVCNSPKVLPPHFSMFLTDFELWSCPRHHRHPPPPSLRTTPAPPHLCISGDSATGRSRV